MRDKQKAWALMERCGERYNPELVGLTVKMIPKAPGSEERERVFTVDLRSPAYLDDETVRDMLEVATETGTRLAVRPSGSGLIVEFE